MPFVLDSSRLLVNPFDFKLDSAAALMHRDATATELAEFFEPVAGELEQFYSLWNAYAENKDELFRLAMAARTWSRVAKLSSTGLTVLFGVFFLEAVTGFKASEFPDWLAKQCDSSASLSMEDIRVLYGTYKTETGALRSVREILLQHLREEEKVELLQGFQFTRPYRLGEDHGPWKHLYCDSKAPKPYPTSEMCGSWCDPPPDSEVDALFQDLVKRLYEMRSAVVHRNAFVLFASESNEDEGIVTVPELYDAFLLRGGKIMGYSTRIEVSRFVLLFKSVAFRYLRARQSESLS